MVYIAPKTWTNEPLVASDLNTHLRDNMEALKDPPSANYELNESSDYTTTSGTFVDIDATAGKLSLSITTTGGDVIVHFAGFFANVNGLAYIDFTVDGTRQGGDDGLQAGYTGANQAGIGFTHLVTGLAAGSHTFVMQWRGKVAAGTTTLYAGAGTTDFDLHPQFWVREVS